jgi:hypothetical protein
VVDTFVGVAVWRPHGAGKLPIVVARRGLGIMFPGVGGWGGWAIPVADGGDPVGVATFRPIPHVEFERGRLLVLADTYNAAEVHPFPSMWWDVRIRRAQLVVDRLVATIRPPADPDPKRAADAQLVFDLITPRSAE